MAAWLVIRRNAETSRSRQTREEARKFGRDLPRQLRHIQDQLRKEYRFAPAIGLTPPKGKGKLGKRPLVIAPLRDRIVQRAILDVLQDAHDLPDVKSVLETPTSVGGVRGRGVDDAIQQIDAAYKAGALYAAGSDISGFFTKIPRSQVIEFVSKQTNDREFIELLARAMTVELENSANINFRDIDLFPTGPDGVAQGCSLSAFAGNVILRDFDSAMNAHGVICIRYIDDFIVLPDRPSRVHKAMEGAERRLAELGMAIYDAKMRPDKAFFDKIENGPEFLGYRLIPGEYPPAEKSQKKLLDRLKSEFEEGRRAIRRSVNAEPSFERSQCLIQTLWNVDQIIRGWSGSYRSSRSPTTMALLDREIDSRIADFIGLYSRLTREVPPEQRRRALGVHLLQDRTPS